MGSRLLVVCPACFTALPTRLLLQALTPSAPSVIFPTSLSAPQELGGGRDRRWRSWTRATSWSPLWVSEGAATLFFLKKILR